MSSESIRMITLMRIPYRQIDIKHSLMHCYFFAVLAGVFLIISTTPFLAYFVSDIVSYMFTRFKMSSSGISFQ